MIAFAKALGTRNVYSAGSQDCNNKFIGSQIVLEQMFNIPGVGRLLFQAIFLRDTPLLEGLVLVVAFVVVFTNLFVDVLYGLLDPRVRLA